MDTIDKPSQCKKCKETLNNSLEIYKKKCKKCMGDDGELHINISGGMTPEIIISENYREDCPFCGIINCNCGSGY
jgi:hypothetical protein